uniref:Apoptotic protease-activating factor-1 n=1 Tax=Bombyx mori TaxID=7091 RepID=A0A5A4PV82_BOMMO|nr:apoptotic protease-activating factor-1 [Bombyx mori]
MDLKNRKLLQHNQQAIIKDLDVQYILDELYTKQAISSEVYEHIANLVIVKNRVEGVRYLIDCLLRYGTNQAYEAFVDSLAKDYNWLWEKFATQSNGPMFNDSFEDSLSKGDVPRLPEHHVRRKAVETEVLSKIKELTRHKILVLHGMLGSGKTCVAINVLRDNPELITNNFNDIVFWMNFANCKTDDDIIAQQNTLLRKISSMYIQNSHMNSSISMSSMGSNIDSHSLSYYDRTWNDFRDRLKNLFSEPPLKEGLLVMDEVNDRKCVEAFDIGCKILITTRDTDVVANYHPQIVTVENSFTERESLELFASCLDEPVSKLPSYAKELNELCKGSPFHVALIGAQLAEDRERLKHDRSHWKYYLKKLKKNFFSVWKTNNDNPMKTIQVCINSLNPNTLAMFMKLAVLPDSVKVTAQVYSKLWNVDVNEVENITKKLKSKSLIIKNYDRDQKKYLYEVHDLIMNYLRSCTHEEEMKKLHDELLNSYRYDSETAPTEIVDDGYIAFYIGFHILKTKNLHQKWSLFSKLYLDLRFLGNKVRLTGPDDVMLDLQKYENYIVRDEIDRNLVYSIKAFLSTHGTDLHHYPCTNIVQSIIQHETKGILCCKASLIARDNCVNNELYFEFMHEHDVEEIKHSTIDVKEVIKSVCFLRNYVIVGTSNGLIKFFNIETNKQKKELKGTGAAIKWIGVACTKDTTIVAALSTDGYLKLWFVDDFDDDDNANNLVEEEPNDAYNNYPSPLTFEPKLGPILNCRWTTSEDLLITHTSQMIILYRPKGAEYDVISEFEREQKLLCCVPCNNDKYIAVASFNAVYRVDLIDIRTKQKVVYFEETGAILDMLVIPGTNKIITLKQNEIMAHEFRTKPASINRGGTVIDSGAVKADVRFAAMAVNNSGSLLFAATDDSRVVCVDLKTNSRVFDIENRRGNVVSMAVSEVLMWDEFEPSSDVLLTGTDSTENSAKVWYLDASYVSQTAQRKGKVRLTSKFDVSFLNATTPTSPSASPLNSGVETTHNALKSHQSFTNKDPVKKPIKTTMSLDRNTLKPLNLKGICNNNEGLIHPLLAVVDDMNNIQVMRGKKVLTEILEKSDEKITAVKVSPCNHYIMYGLKSGKVKRYTLRTKEMTTIMHVNSPVQYLNYINNKLMLVAWKNRCLMSYKLGHEETWKTEMLQAGNTHLGSQESQLGSDWQSMKMRNGHSDLSTSSSEASVSSRENRLFHGGEMKELYKQSDLVDCFWVPDTGLITVESNAAIKLWNKDCKVSTILNARQMDTYITCAAFQNNVLVICDSENKGFQSYELKFDNTIDLCLIQEYKLNNVVTSCDITSDGYILAMGLDCGNVVLWNVKGKRQISLLKHHNSRVQACSFSPVPDRLYRSSVHSPGVTSPADAVADDQPPLVLVTMASEIVWWNITYVIRIRASNKSLWRSGLNVISPIGTPLENRAENHQTTENSGNVNTNFFFRDMFADRHCWKNIWKGKTCKEGSKRKEILACIKLSGINATRLCHDENFSCFVTVDNPGHVHIMNVMRDLCT